MNAQRFADIERLCQAALDLPPEARGAFLNEACTGDVDLRVQVESLLAGASRAAVLLEQPADAPPAPALIVGERLGPYEITARIGAGGMGEVYEARDTRLGRTVAVKVLPRDHAADPDRVHRFSNEAHAVAALNHPNILTIYDVGMHEGTPYAVTEVLNGETWRELLAHRAPTPHQVLALAVQAAQGLAAAHANGIIHRDLKPENLFLTTDGRVKILDFGLAKQRDIGHEGAVGVARTTQSNVLVGTLRYMAPEQIQAQAIDARADVFAFGVVFCEMLTGQHPFVRDTVPATLSAILHDAPPTLSSNDLHIPPAVDVALRRCLAKSRDDRFADGGELAVALDQLLRTPPGATTLRDLEERCPYPGLRSFTEQDAAVFFGREDEITAAWARIRRRGLLAVIGPSGAGKTSFLRAGVVAGRPDGWAAIVCTPGTSPLRGLGQALAPELASDLDALRQLVSFEDPDVAFALLRRWRQNHDAALIVFDQFEEVFTLNPPEVQSRVAALVGRLAAEADVHIVVSLRDDFLMRCHDYAALAPVFADVIPLGALTRTDLQRAVIEPARARGYRVEDDALVDEMVGCVEVAKAALPLLAFAMERMWESRERDRHLLTRAAYEQIGGVAGALAQHAEATLEQIGSMQQDVVRELFRNLVTAHGTRAVIDRDELLSTIPDRAAAEVVLRKLLDARLLTSYELSERPDESTQHRIEIAHESLLTAWPRLVRWQTQDEDGAQLRDQLKQAAHLWNEKGRTADLLWTGTAFEEYSLWRQRYPGCLTAVEEDFAGAMAQRARRRSRRRRSAVAAVIVMLSAVVVAIGISWQQAARARDTATAAAHHAEATKFLAMAELRLAEDPTEALLLAELSLEQADTEEARTFLMRPLWGGPIAFEIAADQGVRSPAFSPDGRWLATAGHTTAAYVWSDDGRGPIVLPGLIASPLGQNMARWAGNDLLVTGSCGVIRACAALDGSPNALGTRVQVWSLPAGKRLRTIEFGAPSSWQVGPSRLLAQTGDRFSAPARLQLRSWQLPDGEPIALGNVELQKVNAADTLFAPDGRALLYVNGRDVYERSLPVGTARDRVFDRLQAPLRYYDAHLDRVTLGDESGRLRLWHYRREGGPELRVIDNPAVPRALPRWAMVIDHSERWTVGRPLVDQEVRIVNLAAWSNARPVRLRRSTSWYGTLVDAHPTGEWLVASTSRFAHLTFWPLRRPYPWVVEGYVAVTRPVAFSPDSRWLVTSWQDSTLRMWPLPGADDTGQMRTLFSERTNWTNITFDPAARYAFAVGNDGYAWIVPLDGSPQRKLEGFAGNTLLQAAAVSPSGQRVATAFYFGQGDKVLRIWDLDSGSVKQFDLPAAETPRRNGDDANQAVTGYERGVSSLSFAGESSVVSYGDGGLRRWDLDAGTQQLLIPAPHGALPGRARFSEDGRSAVFREWNPSPQKRRPVQIYNGRSGTPTELARTFGRPDAIVCEAIDPSGRVVATGSVDGTIRVGRLDRGEPHILVGHKGAVGAIAISADLRWVASTGEDSTLRLWPMPDLDATPLHALPLNQLLAKLRSLTNLRAVRDPAAPSGWRIEIGPFPGWRHVPVW